jgi:hypothetical protein
MAQHFKAKGESKMTNFLTLQDGEYTINVNLISEIDWTEGDEEATVTMVTGVEYTCEQEDYWALRAAIGLPGKTE